MKLNLSHEENNSSVELPVSTDKLYEYFNNNKDEPIDFKEETYSRALGLLTNDMYSMLIFLDYMDILISKEDYSSAEQLYNLHRTKFITYHQFWKKYAYFLVNCMDRDFEGVYKKILKYLRNNNEKQLLEYFVSNKQVLKDSTAYNPGMNSHHNKDAPVTIITTPAKSARASPNKTITSYLQENDSGDFYSIFGDKVKRNCTGETKKLTVESIMEEVRKDIRCSYSVKDESGENNKNTTVVESKPTKFSHDISHTYKTTLEVSQKETGPLKKVDTDDEESLKANSHISVKPTAKENIQSDDISMARNNTFDLLHVAQNGNPPVDQAANVPSYNPKLPEEPENRNYSSESSDLSFLNNAVSLPVLENTQPLNAMKCAYFNDKSIVFLEKIGKGGFSTVHKVLHNDKIYALKRIFKGDYTREISILQKLTDNQYVIPMVDYKINNTDDMIEILLEYGEIDLQRYVNTHKYTNNFIKYISEEILKILAYIHKEKVIHKDLKPSNFVFSGGKLKLIDFGISFEIGPDTTSCLNNKEGTFYYSSPEVFLKRKVGRSSDIWSFGCIIYFLYYKETVFTQGDIHKMTQIVQNKKEINFKKTDRNGDPIDVNAIDLMKCCLRFEPKERHTAGELLKYHPYFQ